MVLIKYSGKYVKIYFNMKITCFVFSQLTFYTKKLYSLFFTTIIFYYFSAYLMGISSNPQFYFFIPLLNSVLVILLEKC